MTCVMPFVQYAEIESYIKMSRIFIFINVPFTIIIGLSNYLLVSFSIVVSQAKETFTEDHRNSKQFIQIHSNLFKYIQTD